MTIHSNTENPGNYKHRITGMAPDHFGVFRWDKDSWKLIVSFTTIEAARAYISAVMEAENYKIFHEYH